MDDNSIDNYIAEDIFLQQLTTACEGLEWSSETDFPLQIVYWQNTQYLDIQTVISRYKYSPDIEVKTKSVESFFAVATAEQSWHGDLEKASTQRYIKVQNLLEENLQDINVYLVGEIEIDVYILGKFCSDSIIGLSTKIVET